MSTHGISDSESAAVLAVLAGSITAIAIIISATVRTQQIEQIRRGFVLGALLVMLSAAIIALGFVVFNWHESILIVVFALYVASIFLLAVSAVISFLNP